MVEREPEGKGSGGERSPHEDLSGALHRAGGPEQRVKNPHGKEN